MITTVLKPGDLILVRGTSLVSRAIMHFGKCSWSHIAVYIGEDKLIESDWGGVQIAPISKYQTGVYNIEVVSINRDLEFRHRFVDKLKDHLDDGYDYALIFGNLLYRLIGELRAFIRLGDSPRRWTCTELAGTSLTECGEKFDADVNALTPDMIAEHFKKEERHGHPDAV